jgi:hypothetical protein|uniref:Type II toxin-antitoxin system Phd/YefM family antitoxin n=1 Tax=Desulfobacca acetoxidans TaxID=60893 RepID=A0A7V6A6P1_9BACT
MNGKTGRWNPESIAKDDRRRAVIPDIDEYQEMLERLEDTEDLKMLTELRQRPIKFRKLGKF